MHYYFYFDETYHDRKIAIKSSGQINTFTADKNDSYVGVFWGIENTKQSSITKKLFVLEKKYLARYGLVSEFKSVNIARKNFDFGVRSYYNIFGSGARQPAGLHSISCLSYNKRSNWLATRSYYRALPHGFAQQGNLCVYTSF